jgi:hypothetical protein
MRDMQCWLEKYPGSSIQSFPDMLIKKEPRVLAEGQVPGIPVCKGPKLETNSPCNVSKMLF